MKTKSAITKLSSGISGIIIQSFYMLRSLVDSCVVRFVFGVIKRTHNTRHNIEIPPAQSALSKTVVMMVYF